MRYRGRAGGLAGAESELPRRGYQRVLVLTRAGRRRLDAAQGSFDDELEARLGAALAPERLDALVSTVRDVRQHIADQQASTQ